MEALVKAVLDWILAHSAEVLIAILGALVLQGLAFLRKLPAMLHDAAEALQKAAEKTPGAADDVAAKLLLVAADVLKQVLDKNFPKK
jgi:hypothetical protein